MRTTAATIMVLVTACVAGTNALTPLERPTTAPAAIPAGQWFGTLQSSPEHAAEDRAAGMRLATIEPTWDRYEPRQDQFDARYVAELAARMRKLREAGLLLVLDMGMQYPPAWVRQLPGAQFVNQFRQVYDQRSPGANGVNAVFSQAVRERQAAYAARLFRDLGDSFFAVRLGWGYYGELQYPMHKYEGKTNCYWAYDELAQGTRPGLAAGVRPCPVPGWKPGEKSPDHRSAERFIDWYMRSLQNYHDWQIATVRKHYSGHLAMLYPSWGVRPGQVAAAVAVDLTGTTSPEINGEIQRGYDFQRFISGIADRGVVVYSTWLDPNPAWSDDAGDNPVRWCPAHYLASLAHGHPLKLACWGENTGPGDAAAMKLTFQRVRQFGLEGFMWAFDAHLHDGKPGHATLADFTRLLGSPAKP